MRLVACIAPWLLFASGCDRLFKLDEVGGLDGPSACTPRSIAPGHDHTCAVDGRGNVYCWGNNQQGEVGAFPDDIVLTPMQVTLPMPALQVASGRDFTCTLLEDGSVWCWGLDDNGQLDGTRSTQQGPIRVPGIGPSAEIAVGGYHACSRDAGDGSIWCWGRSNFVEAGNDTTACDVTTSICVPHAIPGTQGAKRLGVGHRHSCMIGADDRVACWGRNNHLQSGGSDVASQPTPVREDVLGPVVDVTAGGRVSCVIDTQGQTRCWGDGGDGQIANGQFNDATMPTPAHLDSARSVSLGTHGGCAVLADGSISCWGALDGGSGAYQVTTEPQPSLVQGAISVASHFEHTCALVDGYAVCWGANALGQLGRGTRSVATTPTPIASLAGAAHVAAGDGHACALLGGGVQCWGDNDHGEGGNVDLARAYTPAPVDVGGTPTQLFARYGRTCAVLSTGAAKCWGEDPNGVLGDGISKRHSAVPVGVQAASFVLDLAIGGGFLCVLRSTATVECMGMNNHGQLGSAAPNPSLSPQAVPLSVSPTNLVAGAAFACARNTDATVSCWGTNEGGELGIAPGADRSAPGLVPGISGASDLDAGDYFACVRSGATVHCWGRNSFGELGTGDYQNHIGQVQVALGTKSATALWVGPFNACVKTATGEVYCWGANDYGQLGIEGSLSFSTPTLSPGFNNASEIALGRTGTCAITPAGVVCAGQTRMLASGDMSDSTPMRPSLPDCTQ